MNTYDEMTKEDLYALAQEREIEGRSDMSKDELIAALVHDDRTRGAGGEQPPQPEQDPQPVQQPQQAQPIENPPPPPDPSALPPLQATPSSEPTQAPADPYGGSVVSREDHERVLEENRQLKAEVERLNRQLNPQ
jgi:hypothetical protein